MRRFKKHNGHDIEEHDAGEGIPLRPVRGESARADGGLRGRASLRVIPRVWKSLGESP